MSADAKIFQDPTISSSGWTNWCGVHDHPPTDLCYLHTQGGTLQECLESVEACAGKSLRWEWRVYPSGTAGLHGFES